MTEALERSDRLEKPTSIAVKSGQYAQITPCFEEAEGAGQDALADDGGVGEVRRRYDLETGGRDEEQGGAVRETVRFVGGKESRAIDVDLEEEGREEVLIEWHKIKEKEDREAAAVEQAYNKLLSGNVTLLRPQISEGSGGAGGKRRRAWSLLGCAG